MELFVLFFPPALFIYFSTALSNRVYNAVLSGGDATYYRNLQERFVWLSLGYAAGVVTGMVITALLRFDPTSPENTLITVVWAYLGLAVAGVVVLVNGLLKRTTLGGLDCMVVGLIATAISTFMAYAIYYRLIRF